MGLNSRALSRRAFLRAAGVGLSLPLLDAMLPTCARGAAAPPRRMVLINKALGLHAADFFPQKSGRAFELPPYLQEFAEFRSDFTVFSGLSHPGAGGGHSTEASFLTAAAHSGTAAFRNTVSLDQFVAERMARRHDIRFSPLARTRAMLPIGKTRSSPIFATPTAMPNAVPP